MSDNFAVITGGTSGLGLEIARSLLHRHIDVCVVSRSHDRINRAAKLLSPIPKGVKLTTFQANVGSEDQVRALFEYLRSQRAAPTMVFNVAGVARFGQPTEISEHVIDSVLEANLVGLMLVSSRALELMAAGSGGVIINVMSTAALVGRPKEAVYCAAKWGARGFTEALRVATKGSSVKVLAVYPGGMKTPFWDECGISVDTSSFMRPSDVAEKIVIATTDIDSSVTTDLTINRNDQPG